MANLGSWSFFHDQTQRWRVKVLSGDKAGTIFALKSEKLLQPRDAPTAPTTAAAGEATAAPTEQAAAPAEQAAEQAAASAAAPTEQAAAPAESKIDPAAPVASGINNLPQSTDANTSSEEPAEAAVKGVSESVKAPTDTADQPTEAAKTQLGATAAVAHDGNGFASNGNGVHV